MKMFGFAAGFVLAIGATVPAHADCAPLTMITSVDMQIGNDGLVYVPAKINDVDKAVLVDTGGFFTMISAQAVAELKLRTRHTGLQIIGVAGDTTSLAATASFTLGRLRANSMDFMVFPEGRSLNGVPNGVALLAPNLLRSYDVDFDFAGKKFNLLSQDHCEGKVVYWPADAVAVVPMEINSSGHIEFPVELDGQKLSAVLDTGASYTVLNLDVAQEEFAIHPGDADTPQTGFLEGSLTAKTYTHRFKALSFEGIAIGNPTLRLIPDMIHNRLRDPHDTVSGDTHIRSSSYKTRLDDIIVGMDVIHRLHVYIAYKEKKLYITPAAPSAAPAAAKP